MSATASTAGKGDLKEGNFKSVFEPPPLILRGDEDMSLSQTQLSSIFSFSITRILFSISFNNLGLGMNFGVFLINLLQPTILGIVSNSAVFLSGFKHGYLTWNFFCRVAFQFRD